MQSRPRSPFPASYARLPSIRALAPNGFDVAADNKINCPPTLWHAATRAALRVAAGLDVEPTALNTVTTGGVIALTLDQDHALRAWVAELIVVLRAVFAAATSTGTRQTAGRHGRRGGDRNGWRDNRRDGNGGGSVSASSDSFSGSRAPRHQNRSHSGAHGCNRSGSRDTGGRDYRYNGTRSKNRSGLTARRIATHRLPRYRWAGKHLRRCPMLRALLSRLSAHLVLTVPFH